jgi:hypothetical protein
MTTATGWTATPTASTVELSGVTVPDGGRAMAILTPACAMRSADLGLSHEQAKERSCRDRKHEHHEQRATTPQSDGADCYARERVPIGAVVAV